MSYAIHVRVIQAQPAAWFSIVEKTVFSYGTWKECDGEHTLTMGGSGTSGTLRFNNPHGEYFLVALGVHNNKRWCDIVPDLNPKNSGVEIHPTYYEGNRRPILDQQLAHVEKTSSNGVKITVNFYKEDGHTLYATITIA